MYKLDHSFTKPVAELISIEGVHISTFRIFDCVGVRIIDLRDWQRGTYILSLIENRKILQREKFIKY